MNKFNKAFALPNEVWSPVKGYEGLYAVSSMGRVKNLRTGKILKPAKNSDGYLRVQLYKDGKRKMYYVHRLVAEAFLKNPDNLPQINHRDEVKTSNHYSNLEFCTVKENNNYGTRTERAAETLTNRKDLSKQVVALDKQGRIVHVFPSTMEAERQLGCNQSAVAACCRGEYGHKTHHGLIWRYK